jgi:hypothetical protein
MRTADVYAVLLALACFAIAFGWLPLAALGL